MVSSLAIFGYGWLGKQIAKKLGGIVTTTDICDETSVRTILESWQSRVVINAAGKTGKPNIDWCLKNKHETMRSNVIGPLVLAKVCDELGVRLVHLSSGCLWEQGWYESEDSKPDCPSFYAYTKATADKLLLQTASTKPLIVRLRMPISSELNDRNLITKLSRYNRLTALPNSISVVPDFIEALRKLIEVRATGIYNVVNPGSITLPEIMDLYIKHVDPNYKYEVIDKAELYQITEDGRSDATLDTDKLNNYITLPDIHDRVESLMKNYPRPTGG